MEQMIPWLVFCLLFLALALWKPTAARMFAGIFFIIMAVAVNWALVLVSPDLFVGLGADAPLLRFYEWIFTDIVARAPQLVGILAGIVEIVLGLLMLSTGRRAALGLLGGAAFLLLITPLGVWTLPNPIMARRARLPVDEAARRERSRSGPLPASLTLRHPERPRIGPPQREQWGACQACSPPVPCRWATPCREHARRIEPAQSNLMDFGAAS